MIISTKLLNVPSKKKAHPFPNLKGTEDEMIVQCRALYAKNCGTLAAIVFLGKRVKA
jgi:hypothetical protein